MSELALPIAPEQPRPSWPELLSLALILTASAQAIPEWLSWIFESNRSFDRWIVKNVGWNYFFCVLELAIVLLIALPTARRSGIRLGSLRGHVWQVLLVVSVPIILTAIVYPRLSVRPFSHSSSSMWTLVPPAEDILFSGFIYGLLAQRGGRRFMSSIPINPAVLLTAVFFGLWHVPNLLSFPAGYVLFQLLYTVIGAVWTGMTRVWTGSFIYVTVAHAAVNFIAWRCS